ncbi:coatomer protein gamma sub-unit [Nannochloropsis oceanica]
MSGALSSFFILSPRGDTIISRDFRGDSLPNAAEILFRKVKFWEKGDAPPVFHLDGLNFLYVRKNGLLFGATTRFNVSPSTTIELLNRTAKVFKDYCGVLSEESIRKNFILVYELLDEMMDYGYAQATSTESLKNHVYNEPILVESAKPNLRIPNINPKTTPSTAVHKPITVSAQSGGKQKNEIFVDILERLNVLFSGTGYIINSTIDGCIQMKSYLSGNPELKLALNSDLVIGKGGGSGYGAVVLDDCNFHECVRLDEFESSRTLSFFPPDGEFILLNYRITGEFRAPFRIFPTVEEISPYRLEMSLMIRADIPESNYGANVQVRIPMPRSAVSVTTELVGTAGTGRPVAAGLTTSGQTSEYNANEKRVIWNIKKFLGATEQMLRIKITLAGGSGSGSSSSTTNSSSVSSSNACGGGGGIGATPGAGVGNARKEIGPVSMSFEIPMYNVSNLQVRYLRISEQQKSYNPYRWVRYVTQASSFVCRVGTGTER